MKEYIEPVVEVIELSEEDVIATSGGPNGTGKDEETKPGSIGPFGASKAPARNGLYFD